MSNTKSSMSGPVRDAETAGSLSPKRRAAIKHYQKKLYRAKKCMEIVLDPRLEEQSAQWMARVHNEGLWLIQDIRERAGIKGHQSRPMKRRTTLDHKIAGWGR